MNENSITQVAKKRAGERYSPEEMALTKETYLAALEKTGGIRSIARKSAGGVDYNTIDAWKADDPDFAAAEAKALQRGSEAFGDLAEGKLMQQINAGDTTAIIFALKTRFKDRGYVERREVAAEVAGVHAAIIVKNEDEKEAIEHIGELGV